MKRARLLPLLALALALALSGCPDLGDYEVGCFDEVTVGEGADEEDLIGALAVIPCISGNLLIDNTLVQRVSLPSLEEIGGTLAIALNVGLLEIELPALERVGEDITIRQNPVLEVLSLPALVRVGSDLEITGNDALGACDAVAAVVGVKDLGGSLILDTDPEACP